LHRSFVVHESPSLHGELFALKPQVPLDSHSRQGPIAAQSPGSHMGGGSTQAPLVQTFPVMQQTPSQHLRSLPQPESSAALFS
jgi:hypothetical protein